MRRTAILVEVLAPRLGAAVAMASYAIVGFAVLGAFFGVPMFARAACVLAWLGRQLSDRLAPRATATLEVVGDVLVAEDARGLRRLSLATMRSGIVTPDPIRRGARLVVRDRTGPVLDAQFEWSADARAMLRELRLSARERPAKFSFFFGMRVTVGADGILVAWPLLRRRRFVRYADIVDVGAAPGWIHIRLVDGQTYEIGTTSTGSEDAAAQHHALLERIQDACEVCRADGEGGSSLATALGRGGRSALAWVKELRVAQVSRPWRRREWREAGERGGGRPRFR